MIDKKTIYFRKRNDEFYTDFTKEEIYEMIKKDGIDTFIYFCKQLNIPFIKYQYERLKEKYPDKYFGRYLSTMKLTSYRSLTFENSERLY